MLQVLLIVQQLVISEIMFNPNGSEHHDEFIEVFNNSNESINLKDYYITDQSDTDKVILYRGTELIKANSYFLIMDKSYFDNSNYYDDLIPDTVNLFTVDDLSIGKNGLSNQEAENIILFNKNFDLIDSIRYQINKEETGKSYEKRIFFGGQWGFSKSIRGSPGFKNSIDLFEKPYKVFLRSYQNSKLYYYLEKHSNFEDIEVNTEILIKRFYTSGFQDIKNLSFNINFEQLNDSVIHSFPDFKLEKNAQYSFFVQSEFVHSDTLQQIFVQEKFPFIIRHLKLEKPQIIEIENNLSNPIFIENIIFNKTGKNKLIKVNKILQSILTFSKHDNQANIFSENIPHLNSKKGTLKIHFNNQIDSIVYDLNKLAFYDAKNGVYSKSKENYNHQIEWVANPYKNNLVDENHQIFELNSKHFNADHEALEIKINNKNYDLFEIRIYSIQGTEIRNITDGRQYKAIGTWLWDGKMSDEQNCKMGVYIVLVSAREKSTGQTVYKKRPIVLYRK